MIAFVPAVISLEPLLHAISSQPCTAHSLQNLPFRSSLSVYLTQTRQVRSRMDHELQAIWKEAELLSQNLPAGTEESNGRPQSGEPVSRVRFEPGTLLMRLCSLTAP
jgi:hypothetical protein